MNRCAVALAAVIATGMVTTLTTAIKADGMTGEAATLSADPAGGHGYKLSWMGMAGKSYFVQYSDDLEEWHYFPTVSAGAGAPVEWEFVSPEAKNFVRLVGTDQWAADPEAADFDFDKVSNLEEIHNGTDPLATSDGDMDGLPDDWEVAHGLDAGDPGDAASDGDGDGLSALQEFGHGADPERRDSDGDGLLDGFEALDGTPLGTAPVAPHVPVGGTGLMLFTPMAVGE